MLWVIQLLLPLALLLWLAFRPARHRLTRALQIVGTVAMLLALHLSGLWIMPPWWTPWIYWVLFLFVLWRQQPILSGAGAKAADVALVLFWTIMIGGGGWAAGQALSARTPPPGALANLHSPLPAGRYYVANGGSHELLSAHLRTLPRMTRGQRQYWGQSHGVDIIAIDRCGRLASRATPVLSPCTGRVVRTHDGETNSAPVDLTSSTARAGNYALIRCGPFDVLLAHFRNGSLRVRAGDTVIAGQAVGILGNSGTSDMPHLHIHTQRPGTASAPFAGQPLPMRIAGRYLVRGDRP